LILFWCFSLSMLLWNWKNSVLLYAKYFLMIWWFDALKCQFWIKVGQCWCFSLFCFFGKQHCWHYFHASKNWCYVEYQLFQCYFDFKYCWHYFDAKNWWCHVDVQQLWCYFYANCCWQYLMISIGDVKDWWWNSYTKYWWHYFEAENIVNVKMNLTLNVFLRHCFKSGHCQIYIRVQKQ